MNYVSKSVINLQDNLVFYEPFINSAAVMFQAIMVPDNGSSVKQRKHPRQTMMPQLIEYLMSSLQSHDCRHIAGC